MNKNLMEFWCFSVFVSFFWLLVIFGKWGKSDFIMKKLKITLFSWSIIQTYIQQEYGTCRCYIDSESRKREKLWPGPWWLITLTWYSNFFLHWFNNYFSPLKTISLLIQLQLYQILGMSLIQTMDHKTALGPCMHKVWWWYFTNKGVMKWISLRKPQACRTFCARIGSLWR